MPEKILWFFVWKMHTTRQKLKEQLRDCSYIPSGSDNSNRKRRGADRSKIERYHTILLKLVGQLQGGGGELLGEEMGRNQVSLPTQPLVRTPQRETLGPERWFLLLHKTTKILVSHSRNICVCPRYVKAVGEVLRI